VAGEPATPTGWAGKFRLGGLTENAGGSRPVPLSETVCPVFTASIIVRDPVCVPDCVGTKDIARVQLEWALSCVVQLLVTWKGPLTTAAMEVRGRSPLLVRVTF